MNKDDFDVALIPGMRERLAEAYARFRREVSDYLELESPAIQHAITREACPGCGAPISAARPLFTARQLRHVQCPRCELVYTLDIVEEENDRAIYQRNRAMQAYLELKKTPDFAQLETAKADYLAELLARHAEQRGALLDVGCSTGALLHSAERQGFSGHGIEANPDMAAQAQAAFGARVVQGYFPLAMPAVWPAFQAIALLDVLEHIPEPHTFLARLRGHLVDDGLLLVQVPNFNSLLVALEGPANSNFCHGHWLHFTAKTLANLLASSGFKPIFDETIITELDRIQIFTSAAIAAALRRLAPDAAVDAAALDAETIHGLRLGYKLVGVFRKC